MKHLKMTAIALALLASPAWAQSVYSGTRSAADQGISLKAWGSGTAAETDETAYEGSSSLRVSSRNFFQGGIITFANGLDLNAAFADSSMLLAFALRVPNTTGTAGGGGAKVGGGGTGASGAGDEGLGGGRPGSSGGGTVAVGPTSGLTQIRIVVATTDGKRSEAYLDIANKAPDKNGWIKAAVPLKGINGFNATNKTIASIAMAGDTVGSFYVGEISTLKDETPVYCEATPVELNLALGDEVTFTGIGSGGWSPLKYTWDFDSTDGIQVDASGSSVKRRFLRAGDFIITLTVVDIYGLKKPHTSTCKVTVNP